MDLPQGFEKDVRILEPRKGLYGLKQYAALWCDNARAALAISGFFPTVSDIFLYTNKKKDTFVMMHINDFQVMGPNIEKINAFIIHITNPSENTLILSQERYARALIDRYGKSECITS